MLVLRHAPHFKGRKYGGKYKKSLRGFHQAGIYSVGFIVLRYLFCNG
jgi:hypothetical protein